MPDIIPFTFSDMPIRVIEIEGDPWFVAKDVCDVLGTGNPAMAVGRLDDDEKGVSSVDTLGGRQNVTIINESGLYALVMTSRKDAAKRFRKWVTAEVIPSIRKTGGYGASTFDPNDPNQLLAYLETYARRTREAEEQVQRLLPAQEALDRIAIADGSLTITSAAKILQMRPKDLFSWLRMNRWIYRRTGGAADLGYQDKVQTGYLEHKTTTVTRSDGSEKITEQVRVTPKGIAALAKRLFKQGMTPSPTPQPPLPGMDGQSMH